MLSAGDLAVVVALTLSCTGAVTFASLMVLRLVRWRSLSTQLSVIVLATVAAIGCSTVMVAAALYFSVHDLQVLLWVMATATGMSLLGAWLTGRSIRASMGTLGDADMSERLAGARAEIERLDTSRRQFLAWISHDLRTPLTGIRALAEALETGVAVDPADYLHRIGVQSEKMSRLVDDLFELSRMHSGTLRLNRAPVDLLDIVSDAAADVHELASARRVRISHADIEGHMLVADPNKLTRVVVNLLLNGIRYAPEGSEILVSARCDVPGWLVLSVLDQGSGVAAEDLDRMFEVGWRASTARTPDAEARGSTEAGLGLAIVKGIAEAHGGDVRAARTSGGFRLDVVLPTP